MPAPGWKSLRPENCARLLTRGADDSSIPPIKHSRPKKRCPKRDKSCKRMLSTVRLYEHPDPTQASIAEPNLDAGAMAEAVAGDGVLEGVSHAAIQSSPGGRANIGAGIAPGSSCNTRSPRFFVWPIASNPARRKHRP